MLEINRGWSVSILLWSYGSFGTCFSISDSQLQPLASSECHVLLTPYHTCITGVWRNAWWNLLYWYLSIFSRTASPESSEGEHWQLVSASYKMATVPSGHDSWLCWCQLHCLQCVTTSIQVIMNCNLISQNFQTNNICTIYGTHLLLVHHSG